MAKKGKAQGGMFGWLTGALGGDRQLEQRIEQALQGPGHGLTKQKVNGYYKIDCPYCLEKFNVWEMPFRAASLSSAGVRRDELRASGTVGPARKKEEPKPAAAESYFAIKEDSALRSFQARMQKKIDAVRGEVLTVFDTDRSGGGFVGTNIARAVLFDTGEEVEVTEANKGRLYHKAIASVRDTKGNYTSERLCPYCHNVMPDPVGQIPSYVILFMGNTSSGKTVYMIRLLYELSQKGLLQGRPITVGKSYSGDGVDIDYWYDQTFAAMKKKSRSSARPGEKYTLTDPTKVRYMEPVSLVLMRDGQEIALLNLFDFPGEAIWAHAEDAAFQEVMRQRMTSVDGILFLLDPTSMEFVRTFTPDEYLPKRLRSNAEQTIREEQSAPGAPLRDAARAMHEAQAKPGVVLNAFINNYIPNLKGSSLDVPMSIVYSKSDLLELLVQLGRSPDGARDDRVRNLLAPRTRELEDPPRFLTGWAERRLQNSAAQTEYDRQLERYETEQLHAEVDMEDILLADRELRSFLGLDLPASALQNFSRALLFASSAVGAPVSDTEFSEAAPIRLTEPLEYLLWQMGLADSELLPDAWRLPAAKLKQPGLDAG